MHIYFQVLLESEFITEMSERLCGKLQVNMYYSFILKGILYWFLKYQYTDQISLTFFFCVCGTGI
jgi:hypothetical protein